jgi:hypothetical protein
MIKIRFLDVGEGLAAAAPQHVDWRAAQSCRAADGLKRKTAEKFKGVRRER